MGLILTGPGMHRLLTGPGPGGSLESGTRSSLSQTHSGDGRRRVVVEHVTPEVDCGRFAVKRVAGDVVVVEADVFADGHDELTAVLRWRRACASAREEPWREVAMAPLGNDRWRASFPVADAGRYEYTVAGWIDHFATWQHGLQKKAEAGQDLSVDLMVGAGLVEDAAHRAGGTEAIQLRAFALALPGRGSEEVDEDLRNLVRSYPDTALAGEYPRVLAVDVDRPRAAFSAWYELFPRSTAAEPGRHGTLADLARRLPYVADLGFDIVYLPPIHPIGTAFRKGRNNAPQAEPGDPGSPWAIGSAEGGHSAIHPQLGTAGDFRELLATAARLGLEVALDFAIQCSPDHPWVREHPTWFRQRPDGTVQYAENPPKKYQDIVPIDFETPDWEQLWDGLKGVVDHWVAEGVRVFRVDNPHTKAFAFWEWLIAGVKAEHPDVLFLAEAFTRPRVTYRLAKLGFSQSYTYFTWRTTKAELTEYLTELTTTELADYFRPNFWPNTPDILATQLRDGGRPAFIARLVLAATLSGNYGIYGPVFELGLHEPLAPGTEEYVDSEKYEIRHWDLGRAGSLAELIAAVNRARRLHPALQGGPPPVFRPVDNDQLIAYTKAIEGGGDIVLVVVNLDPLRTQSGVVDLPLADLGLPTWGPFRVVDLLTGATYDWQGPRNFVQLSPDLPAHILAVRR